MTNRPTSQLDNGRGAVLLVAGGGTGGHVYPALAIGQEFVARDQSRRVVFVGTARGLETKIVPRAGLPLELIRVGGLIGKSIIDTAKNLLLLPVGIVDAWRVISRHRPAVCVGVGGYASGPALLVAKLRRIPTLIHEQNAWPGVTNRLLARIVDRIAVAFADALPRLGRDGAVTGNPVRSEFFEIAPPREHGPDEALRLLIFGGSQGSRIINRTMSDALLFLAKMKGRLSIVHQTGPGEIEAVRESYRASAFSGARVEPYLDPMSNEIAAADLVVCRAGAMTIGELTAAGRPAVLIPFAAATHNHQEENARVVERGGGAVVITEADLTPEKLAATLENLLGDRAKLRDMADAAKRLARPDATKSIVDLVEGIIRTD